MGAFCQKSSFIFSGSDFSIQNSQQLYRIINHFRFNIGSLPVTVGGPIEFQKTDEIHSKSSFKIKLAFFIKIFIRFLE